MTGQLRRYLNNVRTTIRLVSILVLATLILIKYRVESAILRRKLRKL